MTKDDKDKDTFISVLVGIVLILSIVVLGFVVFKGKKIDTGSDLVVDLYAKLGQNDLSYCDGLILYDEVKVSYDTLSNAHRLCNALVGLYMKESFTSMKVDKTKKNNTCMIGENITFAVDNQEDHLCSVDRYDKDQVNQQYHNIYGKDIAEYETFSLSNTIVCYPDEDYYYCGLAENYNVTIGKEPETYRNIKEVREKGNTLIIYDYFLKMVQNACYNSFTGSVKVENCSKEYSNDKNIDYVFLKKYGKLYRHVFKKGDDDVYYWVSSEPR